MVARLTPDYISWATLHCTNADSPREWRLSSRCARGHAQAYPRTRTRKQASTRAVHEPIRTLEALICLVQQTEGNLGPRTPRLHAELRVTAGFERLFRPFRFCDSSAVSLGCSAGTIGYSRCLTSSGSEGHLFAGVDLIFAHGSHLGVPGLLKPAIPYHAAAVSSAFGRDDGGEAARGTLGPASLAP
jgi:hypothetical protein